MDALSLLRRETVAKRAVSLDGDRIVFGELSCPKDTPTNMKQGNKNEYYTILELYYYYQHSIKAKHRHGEYMIAARKEKIGLVARADTKEIVEYITGRAETSKLLDANNSLIVPVTERHADVRSGKRVAEDSAPADTTAKRPRLSVGSTIGADLGLEKIQELRKKRAEARAKKPPRLKIAEIVSREVVFEDRVSCLRSTKSFQNVLDMLSMSKKKDSQSKQAAAKPSGRSAKSYDRYDQPTAPAEGAEFGINEEGNFSTQQKESSSSAARKEAESSMKKKGSKTPIIIVPNTITADGISLYNVVAFLEEGQFLNAKKMRSEGKTKPLHVVVHKKRARRTAQYKVVDNINGLTKDDWDRVVACFVSGPEWELKKYPAFKDNSRGVPGVFQKMCGFYVYFDDQRRHANADK